MACDFGVEEQSKFSRDFDRGVRFGRRGNTTRRYQAFEHREPKRGNNEILFVTGVDGVVDHTAGTIHLSLDKKKRWELVDAAEADPSFEISVSDGTSRRNAIKSSRAVAAFQQRLDRPQEDAGVGEEEEEDENDLTSRYRFTKGGPKGVMISWRRTPGKKGVKRPQPAQEPSRPLERAIVVQTSNPKKIDYHRKSNGLDYCSHCGPRVHCTGHHDSRQQKKHLQRSMMERL